MSRLGIICFCLLGQFVVTVHGRVLWVPQQFSAIQDAIDDAIASDTIVMSAGNYAEAVVLPTIPLVIGSAYLITGDTSVIENCRWSGVISGSDSLRCLTASFNDNLPTPLEVSGISFDNSMVGRADSGGAIFARNSDILITHCRFDSCIAGYGGAVATDSCITEISDCRFVGCTQIITAAQILSDQSLTLVTGSSFVNGLSLGADDDQPTQFDVAGGQMEFRLSSFHLLGTDRASGTIVINAWQHPVRVEISECEFRQNRIAPLVSYGGEQVEFLRLDSNTFVDNGLAGALYSQDAFDSGTVFQAIGNTFERFQRMPGYMMHGPLALDTSAQNVTIIERNLVTEMDSGHVAFCSIHADQVGLRRIRHNYIVSNSNWSWTYPPSGMVLAIGSGPGEFAQNVLRDNLGYSVYRGPIETPSYATMNFFGDSTGPYDPIGNPGGHGDSIDWRIIYQPWETDTSFFAGALEPPAPIEVPESFIGNAYPNPFNSTATIEFVLLHDQEIVLSVFDLNGRKVDDVFSGRMRKGVHIRDWSPQSQASGIYFARLAGSDDISTTKLLYLK